MNNNKDEKSMLIENLTFAFVTKISLFLNADGIVEKYMPQERYKKRNLNPLHRYGNGPFCRFKIPNNIQESGVYAITQNGCIAYIGRCENLSSRFNIGYGQISPRNCFSGGQQTNCRINNKILKEISEGRTLKLFFYATPEYKCVEASLIGTLNPIWNL